jgi:regulator of sirC expression with transglutaminase-like and TPR domain
MLQNLRRVYAERKDDVRTFWVLDRILLLAPGQLEALRDRGLAAARLGGNAAAVRDLEAYVEGARGAGDVQAIRELLAGLRAGRGALLN